MYEAAITVTTPNDAPEGTQLRAPQWPELVAKLAAMRELRLSLARQESGSIGAFSSFARFRGELSHQPDSHNRKRAAAPESQIVNETARSVNPNALADRKGAAVNNAALNNQEMQFASPRDREIK